MNISIENEQNMLFKQLVTFKVDQAEYGLEILYVQEIGRLPQITKLPKTPSFIKGVIDLRGIIIPVLDLRDKFGLISKQYSEKTRVIIIEISDKKLGIVVDNVSQVIRVPESSIAPPPPITNNLSSEYVEGVARLEGRLIVLLKTSDLLSSNEIRQLDEIEISGLKKYINEEYSLPFPEKSFEEIKEQLSGIPKNH